MKNNLRRCKSCSE